MSTNGDKCLLYRFVLETNKVCNGILNMLERRCFWNSSVASDTLM